MRNQQVRSLLVAAGAAAVMLAGSIPLGAQREFNNNLKYDSGQDVQPVYEGWARRADGTFDLYFGYLNRNWVQTLEVPVGPNNNLQPGPADQGQPTFFYTRTNRKVFTVNVPKDFGGKEVIWTLTANGSTRTTYGHLRPDWEITPDGGASGTTTTKEARSNQAPTLAVAPAGSVQMPATLTLAAVVTDDGLPRPRPRNKPAVGQETPPGLTGGLKDAPSNLPWLSNAEGRPTPGLAVRWFVFRGPADADFNPARAEVVDGKASATVSFSTPGEYVLRVAAMDGLLTTYRDVTVTVR
jgi:hypothetical protein